MESTNAPLASRRILVCVSASIAAYKSVYLIRSLKNLGAHVSVALTPATQNFVGTATFSAVASEPAYDDLWDIRGSISHTTLGKSADLVVVVPASASVIAKMAQGIADDIVTASLLCTPTSTPVVVVPAMHEEMFDHPSTQDNILKLRQRGISFVGPVQGELAGGDTGRGRMSEPADVVKYIVETLDNKELRVHDGNDTSVRVPDREDRPVLLITAGGTREPIDPVRVITNRSSGKMGHALAHAAYASGYRVVLITTSDLPSVEGIIRIDVETAAQMHDAVSSNLSEADVVIMAAAVADLTPKSMSLTKLKRAAGIGSIDVVPTTDILGFVVDQKSPHTFVVGFAAENENVLSNAETKFEKKNIDLLVANDVSHADSGFESNTNKVWIFQRGHKPVELDTMPKEVLAYEILELIESARASS